MNISRKVILVGILLGFATVFSACDKPGPAEKAGEKIDQTTKTIGEQSEKTGEVIGDAAITTKVKAAILAEPGLSSLQISVDTTQGEVILSGAVNSQQDIDRAKEVASAVDGVTKVDNRLTLKSN